ESIAHTITYTFAAPFYQGEALAGVAGALAGVDPDRAELIARSITSPLWREWALGDLARALAGVDPDRAALCTHTLTDPVQRSWALARLAGVLADSDLDHARQVLGLLLASPRGVDHLGAVVAVDVAAAAQIADHLLSSWTKESALPR